MKRIHPFFLLLFLASLSACDPTTGEYELPQKVLEKQGDDHSWSSADFDDRDWEEGGYGGMDSIYWLRMHFQFEEELEQNRHKGLYLFGYGAQEFYWDGHLIGTNGVPGISQESEEPGKLTAYFLVPDSMATAGDHILALRCSQQYRISEERFLTILAADYENLLRYPLIITSFMHILAGAYLLAAIYFLFLFLSYRNEATVLIFSICCFLFFGLILLEYLKYYVLYPYPWHTPRLEFIHWFTMGAAFWVPLFFGLQFSFPKLKWAMLGYGLVLLLFYFSLHGKYDTTARMMGRCMWMASLLIVGYAVFRTQKGALLVFAGLLISGVIDAFLIYDISLYLSFSIIVFSMFFILTLRGKEQQKAYEASLLRSVRLKNELLKKHIRPHFIMNTLTSLIDWVEESPQEGVKFMEALAEEFDILNQVADHQLIPITQEIQLCISHLTVMGYRKEIAYEWEEEGIDPKEMIPPALIHTALENGITHSLPQPNGSIGFKLTFEETEEGKQYTFFTFAQNRPNRTAENKGTGMHYIESRLRESYGDQWRLTSHEILEGWKTQFTIFAP